MAQTVTRLQIKDMARLRADMGTSAAPAGSTSDAQANTLLDSEWRDLYRLLAAADPDRFILTDTIATTAGTREYALESDFQRERRVDWVNGTTRVQIFLAPLQEVDRSAVTSATPGNVVFRIIRGGITGSGVRIAFYPDPGTGTYEMEYVTTPGTFANDAATLDCSYGEDNWLAYGLAAALCEREEHDSMAMTFRRRQAEIGAELSAALRQRHMGQPKRIIDVRSQRRVPRERYPLP